MGVTTRVGLSAISFVPFLFTKGYRLYPSRKFSCKITKSIPITISKNKSICDLIQNIRINRVFITCNDS